MDAVVWAVVGAGGVLVGVALMQVWMQLQTSKRKGQPVPRSKLAVPAQGPALVYFWSPTCGPCRAMRPAVDALEADGKPVVKVDVSRDVDVALAWNVMGTPTTIAIHDGRITEVLLGAQHKDRLERALAG